MTALSLRGLRERMPEAAVAPGDAALARVLSLPRREPASPELIEALSTALRTRERNDEGEVNRLRVEQVEALCELYEYRGLFAPMRVGSGKSLVTLLAATLLSSQRPVLLIPAALREKTEREFAVYARNWRVRLPKLVSYQELGRPEHEKKLLELAPDLLIADEAQWLFNYDSAVARRWRRCIDALHPVAVVLSGTLLGENLMRYHPLAVGVLGDRAPLPVQRSDAERWATALDRDLGLLHRKAPGALESIPGGYHEWLRNSRGVVPTSGSDCTSSIQVSIWRPNTPPALQKVIEDVKVSGLRPDDELLDELELPDCLQQLALGFYYRWDPMPPEWWLRPRRAWRVYVRDVLDEHLEGFDSESQVVSALDGGGNEAPDSAEGRRALAAWRAVRDQFEPNPVPVWLDTGVMAQAAEHAKRAGTLVWTRFRAAGAMLGQLGVPYYGGGTQPETAKPGAPIALSIAAHATGRNLQAWHRSLVLTPPANADSWEQLVGRTHRAGQKADPVIVECIGTIDHHGATLGRVLSQARAITKASGFTHKLVLADWI